MVFIAFRYMCTDDQRETPTRKFMNMNNIGTVSFNLNVFFFSIMFFFSYTLCSLFFFLSLSLSGSSSLSLSLFIGFLNRLLQFKLQEIVYQLIFHIIGIALNLLPWMQNNRKQEIF